MISLRMGAHLFISSLHLGSLSLFASIRTAGGKVYFYNLRLSRGRFVLVSCSGIFPDGGIFVSPTYPRQKKHIRSESPTFTASALSRSGGDRQRQTNRSDSDKRHGRIPFIGQPVIPSPFSFLAGYPPPLQTQRPTFTPLVSFPISPSNLIGPSATPHPCSRFCPRHFIGRLLF